MSADKTRRKVEIFVDWLEERVHLYQHDRDAIAAELRRLSASEAELIEALEDLTLNVNEAMKTGGWVPTPLHASFFAAMADALDALARAKEARNA